MGVCGGTPSSRSKQVQAAPVHRNNMTHKHRWVSIFLIIFQAWLAPCHGFASLPYCLERSRAAHHAARHGPFAPAPWLRAPRDVGRRPLSCLRITDQGGDIHESYGDEEHGPPWGREVGVDSEGITPVQPYQEEHTAGGSRFHELLARSKRETPARPRQAAPRRPVPPGGPIDYDQDRQFEEQLIGSPDLPDPPLLNEMPGLRLSPEMDYDGPAEAGSGHPGGSGDRFQRMMQQAQINDQRQSAGMPPRSAQSISPPPPGARPPPLNKEEKEMALKAAVERQQKMMSKARGIDLDDPTLEGPELAKKKALSRAQAEATTGGYVPSSSSSDNYLAALKVDSKRKHRELQAKLEGRSPFSNESTSMQGPEAPALSPELVEGGLQQVEVSKRGFVPQRRTKALSSIQNSADVYMASLKGIKVELPSNPYMAEKKKVMAPGQNPTPERIVRPPPKEKPPAGPTMSYAERLKLAREKKGIDTATPPVACVAAPSHAPAVAAAVVSANSDSRRSGAPTISYAEKLKQAREAKAARVTGSPPPPRPAGDHSHVHTVRAATASTRLGQDAFGSSRWEGDDTHTKMMRAMDLLTEHKTAGIFGEERVAELRRALVVTREALRAEMREESGPWRVESTSVTPPVAPPSVPQSPRPASANQGAAALPAPLTSEDRDALRRCSLLLQAHAHSSLTGRDLVALREGLASSLEIVGIQASGKIGTDGGFSGVAKEPLRDVEVENEAVPSSVGGVLSVGEILSEMGVSKKPEAFEPEDDSSGEKGWIDGNLGEYEKSIGSKALGYLLKHRGGKGYGRGRVKGAEAQAMISTLAEVVEIFQEEMVEDL